MPAARQRGVRGCSPSRRLSIVRRIVELSARELEAFNAKTPGSAALYERARKTLACGIGSSYQWRDPWPIYLREGRGSHLWDIDGNEYLDYLNGFGSMVQGHAHPAIVKAVQEQVLHGRSSRAGRGRRDRGRGAGPALELPKWRFTNTGSESTMDAIRIARAVTGRDTVMKIFGSYHGHHDYVMVSVRELRRLRTARRLRLVPLRRRHPGGRGGR